LNKAERNYATIEQEALAIIFTVKTFRPYIYGHKCVLYTDHAPLKFLNTSQQTNQRLLRWSLSLQEHGLQIEYRTGMSNANADALSRNPVLAATVPDFDRSSEQKNDEFFGPIFRSIEQQLKDPKSISYMIRENILYYTPKHGLKNPVLVIPRKCVPELIENCHNIVFAAHLGFAKTGENATTLLLAQDERRHF